MGYTPQVDLASLNVFTFCHDAKSNKKIQADFHFLVFQRPTCVTAAELAGLFQLRNKNFNDA